MLNIDSKGAWRKQVLQSSNTESFIHSMLFELTSEKFVCISICKEETEWWAAEWVKCNWTFHFPKHRWECNFQYVHSHCITQHARLNHPVCEEKWTCRVDVTVKGNEKNRISSLNLTSLRVSNTQFCNTRLVNVQKFSSWFIESMLYNVHVCVRQLVRSYIEQTQTFNEHECVEWNK